MIDITKQRIPESGAPPARAYPESAERPRVDESQRTFYESVAGGATAEALAGLAVVVLCALGLAGIFAVTFAAISALCLGGAFLLRGGAMASGPAPAGGATAETFGPEWAEGGLGGEVLGGATGIVLGILSLIGIVPAVLLPVSVIVFGGSLLIAGEPGVQVATVTSGEYGRYSRRTSSLMAANGLQVLVAMGAVVLGILALVNVVPLILTLVGFLSLGAASIASGGVLSRRMMALIRRR